MKPLVVVVEEEEEEGRMAMVMVVVFYTIQFTLNKIEIGSMAPWFHWFAYAFVAT